MNIVFAPYVRKFLIVFLDDILIYSHTLHDHLAHLQTMLEVLRKNQLFDKMTKCSFARNHMEYLGHIISQKGVLIDLEKTIAMEKWPQPMTITELWGFVWAY